MNTEIESNEIQELLSYIEAIKNYDLNNYFQIQRVLVLIWGSLLLFAGFMDFYINTETNPTHALPWFLANIIGIFFSIYLNKVSGDLSNTKEIKASYAKTVRINKVVGLTIGLWWIMIVIGVYIFGLAQFIIIFVGFALGSMMFVFGWKEYDRSPTVTHRFHVTKPGSFIGWTAIIISLFNTFGVLFIGKSYYVFSSLTFGIFVGSAFIIVGLVSWK